MDAFILDNYATVAEAVEALRQEPFAIVAPDLPGGKAAGGHIAIADSSGDSAVFEYIQGKLVIHHDRKYTVMTNSPAFDQQLAINTYWNDVGGLKMLPGTHRASDRFARVSWNLIYELRVRYGSVNYRMLYFFHEGTAVVSHGVTKEDVVPDREINIAMSRKAKFEKAPKKHTYKE